MGSNNNPSWFVSANGFANDFQRPVEKVTYANCLTFINRLNQKTGRTFRLLTEAEWEYAARGGNKSQGYKYAGSNNIDDVAWYGSNSGLTTHAVGTKSPNELGLYDMSGNVWEWCQDWYGSYSSGAQTNPTGPSTGSNRVLRGGCWDGSDWSCRVSYRSSFNPANSYTYIGLRLAF
jgi:formylglycine-generating enzyme required for sulfatase activity